MSILVNRWNKKKKRTKQENNKSFPFIFDSSWNLCVFICVGDACSFFLLSILFVWHFSRARWVIELFCYISKFSSGIRSYFPECPPHCVKDSKNCNLNRNFVESRKDWDIILKVNCSRSIPIPCMRFISHTNTIRNGKVNEHYV